MSRPNASLGTSPLYVESRGEGEPAVVLVHGFGGNRHFWRKWVPRLEQRGRVYLVDLMGSGQAAAPSGGDYSCRAQAGHLVELLRRLPHRSFVLVGHSLGAAVVLLAALRIRDEGGAIPLKGLVVLSGTVYRQRLPPFLSLARIPLLGDLLYLLPPPRWAMTLGIRTVVHQRQVVDAELVEGYRDPLKSFRRRRALLRAGRQINPSEGDTLATRLAELAVPALVIWGEEDPVAPPASADRLARDLRGAKVVMMDRVGHLPPEEKPAESLAPVLEFLEDLGFPAPGS